MSKERGKRVYVFQGEWGIFSGKDDFESIYVPGIESDGCTFLCIRASKEKGGEQSYFLVAHLDHFNLLIHKENTQNGQLENISKDVKSYIISMFKELKKRGNSYFDVTIYDGSINYFREHIFHIQDYITKNEFFKEIEANKRKININFIQPREKGNILSFTVTADGQVKIESISVQDYNKKYSMIHGVHLNIDLLKEFETSEKTKSEEQKQRYMISCFRNETGNFEETSKKFTECRSPICITETEKKEKEEEHKGEKKTNEKKKNKARPEPKGKTELPSPLNKGVNRQ